ncbi:MAG: hypothetical protein IPH13_16100 [Planctomycetes bacterium]|nr:hypothetical protein [Planctomycetota bacterium]MCC7170495.1 hypothetical protein [Planctomycetota bacterium]
MSFHAVDGSPDDGIRVVRRSALFVPFALGASLMAGRLARGAADADEDIAAPCDDAFRLLTRDEFAAHWRAAGRRLPAAALAADEVYAAQLAAWIARVPVEQLPRLDVGDRKPVGRLLAGPSWFPTPCIVVEFQMQPGAVLRPHNHPPQVVVTLALEGECEVRHYEVGDDAPPCTLIDGTEFEVRETKRALLTPGRTTSLTRSRDGIHGFVAGSSGATLLDFICATTDDIETFSYLEIGPQPIGTSRDRHRARWTGKE